MEAQLHIIHMGPAHVALERFALKWSLDLLRIRPRSVRKDLNSSNTEVSFSSDFIYLSSSFIYQSIIYLSYELFPIALLFQFLLIDMFFK